MAGTTAAFAYPAQAQIDTGAGVGAEGAETEVERAYQEAFEAMLEDPTDTEKAFRFAEAAVAVGDLAGAIAALERILQIDPDRPDIKLRLGELYQRAGAPVVAQVYLARGLETTEMPPDVRERAQELQERAQRIEAALARHRFSGSVFVGGRFETNANGGPDSTRIRLFGFEGPFLAEEDTEEDDFSVLGSIDLDYAYDFGTQAGHALETDLLLFGSRYQDVNEANTWLADFELGPRLFVGTVADPIASLRPFGAVTFVALDDETYLKAYGGGLNLRGAPLPNLLLETTARGVFQDFDDTDEQPRGSDQTGPYYTLRPGVTWEVIPGSLLSLDGLVGYQDADEDFEAFLEYGASLSATQLFAVPFGWITEEPWSATLTTAYRHTDFDEPDIQIDPDEEQEDDRVDITLSLVVPITHQLGVSATGRQTFNDSNLPNEEFDNTQVTLGVALTF